jgi:hypothetical protein
MITLDCQLTEELKWGVPCVGHAANRFLACAPVRIELGR